MKRTRSRHELCWPVVALLALGGCPDSSSGDRRGNANVAAGSTSSTAAGTGADALAGSDANAGAAGSGEIATELTISGPVTGGMQKIFTASSADLPAYGYTEKEFFIEGTATAYTLPGGLTMDGKWSLVETTQAPYRTRLLVRRPADASKFNGTVVVEWLNVSGGADGDPGFMYNADLILREGYASHWQTRSAFDRTSARRPRIADSTAARPRFVRPCQCTLVRP